MRSTGTPPRYDASCFRDQDCDERAEAKAQAKLSIVVLVLHRLILATFLPLLGFLGHRHDAIPGQMRSKDSRWRG
jgi:hypothetical protein